MSLYHIVFLFLLFGVLVEFYQKKTPKFLLVVSFLLLSAMMVLRFGQGTDYYSYSLMYATMPRSLAGVMTYTRTKAEIGWRVLFMLSKNMGLSFAGFIFITSAMEMLLLWRFLRRYCENRMLALFLGYHTLYLTYFFSALRQAMVIAIFLGILLEWLLDGKWVRYCIGVLLCSTIHTVSIILLVPVIFLAIDLSFSRVVCITAIGFALGIVFSLVDINRLLARFLSITYLEENNISLIALLERSCTYILVTYMMYIYVDGIEPDQNDKIFKIYKIYSLSVILYGLLMWSPLISSRTVYILKTVELALISLCIVKCKKARVIVLIYSILLSSMFYVKNISSYIAQGSYVDTSVRNYPYVSIFNRDLIAQKRGDTGEYIEWLELK